ncbi:PKD domain-containing protein [Shewanella corallii]|uniref:PKD domain-containing protein n=1 Tax=Shewanella corallii TaxID=560080 RepID=A0ABT0NAS3_9GAMM|nr:PKD domain-containing protein [Shewanella corallii]
MNKLMLHLAGLLTIGSLSLSTMAWGEESKALKVRFLVAAEDKQGTDAQASEAMIEEGLDKLNIGYAPIGVTFELNDIVYVTNEEVPGFHDPENGWDYDDEELLRPFFALDSYNIIVTEVRGVNGHAWWPYEATDAIEVDPTDLVRTTPVHEIGHNLSLRHTYQSNGDGPISLLEGPEGWKYGDHIIDTPPDPDRDDLIENCVYFGDVVDDEGVAYDPDAKNYMSGGSNKCRTRFSAQQYTRMESLLSTDKYHLFNKYGEGRVLPTCDNSTQVTEFPHHEGFNVNDEVAETPWVQDVVHNRYNWRFDSDTSSSRTGADEPVDGHTFIHVDTSRMDDFIGAGDHVVMLSPCFDLTQVTDPSVNFFFNMYGADMGTLSLQASVDNGSSWQSLWQMVGPQHADGDWEEAEVDLADYVGKKVQLRLDYQVDGEKGDASVDAITLNATPVTPNEPPQASFSYETQKLVVSLLSTSVDSDGEIVSFQWDLGDGNTAEGESVEHTYSSPGEYQVSLTVTDDGGLTNTVMETIRVKRGKKPKARIKHLDLWFMHLFISMSYDPDGYIVSQKWRFNDGSRVQGPVAFKFGHRASRVKLVVKDNDGMKGKAKLRF